MNINEINNRFIKFIKNKTELIVGKYKYSDDYMNRINVKLIRRIRKYKKNRNNNNDIINNND